MRNEQRTLAVVPVPAPLLPAIIEEEVVTGEIVSGPTCWNCLSTPNVRCCEFGRDR